MRAILMARVVYRHRRRRQRRASGDADAANARPRMKARSEARFGTSVRPLQLATPFVDPAGDSFPEILLAIIETRAIRLLPS
jgi:hypothetical protein